MASSCALTPASSSPKVVWSPWDSYVTSRMVTLSMPCRALMNAEPATVRPDDRHGLGCCGSDRHVL
jgi:manganese-dependent inorganic pyrophosphatase